MKSETCPQCYGDGVYTPSRTTATIQCPRCSGTGKVEIPPTPDLPALLARCKPWLEEKYEVMESVPIVGKDGHVESAHLERLNKIRQLLADLAKAGVK